jgi:hypothetical protein
VLEEYKELCKEAANAIPGWQSLSKNELCRLCVENENNPELHNAYFAAIQYKYWGLIAKYHASCNGLVEPEVCRDWLVDTIMYALEHRRWEDEDSTIFDDPNGPDKAINTKMKCMKINQYQYSNRKKRKDAFGNVSLDEMTEKFSDGNLGLLDTTTDEYRQEIDINEYIRKLFRKKDYFMAYMLDAILNSDVFEDLPGGSGEIFSVKKLSRFMRRLDGDYCRGFAQRYEVDEGIAVHSLVYFYKLNIKKVNQKIEYNIHKLRHDPFILEMLGGIRK